MMPAVRPPASQPARAVILYEYPFNERIRTYLRLEDLFRRLGELVPRTHALDHHFAIQTILEVMDVAARADMKTDVLKDLEKHKQQLNSYRGNPAISEAALAQIVGQLDSSFTALHAIPGKNGQTQHTTGNQKLIKWVRQPELHAIKKSYRLVTSLKEPVLNNFPILLNPGARASRPQQKCGRDARAPRLSYLGLIPKLGH